MTYLYFNSNHFSEGFPVATKIHFPGLHVVKRFSNGTSSRRKCVSFISQTSIFIVALWLSRVTNCISRWLVQGTPHSLVSSVPKKKETFFLIFSLYDLVSRPALDHFTFPQSWWIKRITMPLRNEGSWVWFLTEMQLLLKPRRKSIECEEKEKMMRLKTYPRYRENSSIVKNFYSWFAENSPKT